MQVAQGGVVARALSHRTHPEMLAGVQIDGRDAAIPADDL
jgi:hypothetical protein